MDCRIRLVLVYCCCDAAVGFRIDVIAFSCAERSSKTDGTLDDVYEMRDLFEALDRGIGFRRAARLFSIWEREKSAGDRKRP